MRTARAIDLDEPGFAAHFLPPETPSPTARLTATDAILGRLHVKSTDDNATKTAKAALAAKFVAHELPADFVQNLADEESADNEGMESTAAIGRLIRAGMKELTTLDAIMHNKYARQPDKLRAWQSASHVERAPQREKKKPEADKDKAAPAETKSESTPTKPKPTPPQDKAA